MSAAATTTARDVRQPPSAGEAFSAVLDAAITRAAAKVEHTVVGWSEKLDRLAGHGHVPGGLGALAGAGMDGLTAGGGAKEKAGAEGLKATLRGENPFWPAVRGAWQAGTPVVRAAIVTSLVAIGLLVLVSPVLAVVFLLALLAIAAVHRTKAAGK